jgi:hypothetical protein
MTNLLRRTLRRLDASVSKALHSAFAPFGQRYLDVARRP